MITTAEIERNRRAWELVRRLSENEAQIREYDERHNGFFCVFCDANDDEPHATDCIWLEARRLVEGE